MKKNKFIMSISTEVFFFYFSGLFPFWRVDEAPFFSETPIILIALFFIASDLFHLLFRTAPSLAYFCYINNMCQCDIRKIKGNKSGICISKLRMIGKWFWLHSSSIILIIWFEVKWMPFFLWLVLDKNNKLHRIKKTNDCPLFLLEFPQIQCDRCYF